MSQLDDYNKVRAVLEHLHEGWRTQPSLAELASPVGLSEDQLQKLFTRWAGLTPKAFLQALTLDHARAMLQDSASILDTALDLGLSGPGRLHDLFIAHEAMSPGAYKSKGAGLTIYFGFHPSPFGIALAMITSHGLCGLSFNDDGGDQAALVDMKSRWPNAQYTEDSARTAPYVARIFGNIKDNQPIRITMIGSDFEISVWETLLKIPMGRAVAYSHIAASIGKPNAARAVGAAVGRNPISFVVPCHRALGKSGALTGYHWGLTRKKAILGWEAGRLNSA